MREEIDTRDAAIARIAARQHGVVTAAIDGQVHVSIPSTSGHAQRRGIRLHRCPSLSPRLVTHRDRIPVTTVSRTIEDLRRTSLLPPRLLRRAIRQAELAGHHLVGVESDRTRSDLETLFLSLCTRHRLPPAEVNVKLGRWEVDFLWRCKRLVVEVDSWAYHRGSVAFEDDHARDLDLRAAGYTALRFTARQLEDGPERVAGRYPGGAVVESPPCLTPTPRPSSS